LLRMKANKERKYVQIGSRLRAVREHLHLTLAALGKEVGIAVSHLSDFERGYTLPNFNYLKYLHDCQRINLNYIFGSDMCMIRSPEDELVARNLAKYEEEVSEMLRCMADVPHLLSQMLSFFSDYKVTHQELIEIYLINRDQPD
jgi:transcriptional regulator with XRE-family HTH domain